ncbi:MAG: saccharopine dehydrogenase [Candidatus Bathyarchaeota archaeon B23]|nr:MAG: saccharopine dehydrogenase [Candidatus Bathyarchaeota archaeon B23]
MRIIVIGCGKIGSTIAKDLSEALAEAEITVADKRPETAERVASTVGGEWTTVDASDRGSIAQALRGFDLAVGALPGDYGYGAMEAAVEAGVDMVDVSYTPENPLTLDGEARRRGMTLIPDCGVAPGLSNMLVGYGASKLDEVREAHILVGGIPERMVPPLGYTITWSAEGLIDEYVRPVHIVEGGRVLEVPALSGLEEVEFPGLGRLEAFYTDGLRTLIDTFRGVESMYEKTLRYPGHVERVRLLRELGLFDEEPIEVDGVEVSPKLFTARLLERHLRMPEVGDLLAMMVEVKGVKAGEGRTIRFHLLDRYDRVRGVTAMARTTGYTASIVAQLLAKGRVEERGVVPPERLGLRPQVFEEILMELRRRGVEVVEQVDEAGG